MSGNRFADIPAGEIIATGVSEADYLEKYAADFCEWVDGQVIRIAPETFRHGALLSYLATLLEAYCELKPIATSIHWPLPMRLPTVRVCREPNLMIVLKPREFTNADTALNGAADICIEVISPESIKRDRGDKFEEYEKGGVGEYWIWDILRAQALFYRLNGDGVYLGQSEDADGNYRPPLLPELVVNVPTLWRDKLPGPGAVVRAVEAMLQT